MLPDLDWFAAFGGPPCQASSRRNSNPTKDTSLFQAMANIVQPLIPESDLHMLFENVVPHRMIADIREDWDGILGMTSQRHNAITSGSIAVRDRLYWTNSLILGDLRPIVHRMPDVCCDAGWVPETRPVPTLMAMGNDTDKPPWVVELTTGRRMKCVIE